MLSIKDSSISSLSVSFLEKQMFIFDKIIMEWQLFSFSKKEKIKNNIE